MTERLQTIHTGSPVVQIKSAALKAVHRIFQLIFMLGPLFFPIVTKKRDNKKVDLFTCSRYAWLQSRAGNRGGAARPIECDEIAVRATGTRACAAR